MLGQVAPAQVENALGPASVECGGMFVEVLDGVSGLMVITRVLMETGHMDESIKQNISIWTSIRKGQLTGRRIPVN